MTVHLKYRLCRVCKTNYTVSQDRCWLCFISKKKFGKDGLTINAPTK